MLSLVSFGCRSRHSITHQHLGYYHHCLINKHQKQFVHVTMLSIPTRLLGRVCNLSSSSHQYLQGIIFSFLHVLIPRLFSFTLKLPGLSSSSHQYLQGTIFSFLHMLILKWFIFTLKLPDLSSSSLQYLQGIIFSFLHSGLACADSKMVNFYSETARFVI